MKRVLVAVVSLAVLVVAVPAFAGGEHCTAATQECLDMMTKNLQHRGYIGIEMDESEDNTVVIRKVVADSPAEKAGVLEGDLLLTVNGMAPEEAFKALHEKMVPGAKFTLAVQREGAATDLAVTLEKVPEELMARWIGAHMMQHATAAQEAEEE